MIESSTTTAAPGLAGFLAVVKRWRWMLIAATIAAALAGYLSASAGDAQYESRAVLLVGPINAGSDTLRASGQLAETYAQLATTQPVLAATGRRLGLTNIGVSITATASEVTRLLTIRVINSDPRLAAKIANTHANQLIDEAERRSAPTGDSAETGKTDEKNRGSEDSGRLEIVDPAEPDDTPTGTAPAGIALLAAVAGLFGATMIALLLDRSGDTVNGPRDLEAATGVPCVGSLSRPALRLNRDEGPVVQRSPDSRAANEYRLLAAKLGASGGNSLLVMALDGDGSVLASNLAVALAAGGTRVALVDVGLALGDPVAMAVNGAVPAVGRDNGQSPFAMPGVKILGAPAVEEARAAGPDGPRALLDELESEVDVVLVHAPPFQRSPGGLPWARAVDGTLLVAQRDRTITRDLRTTVETLALVHATLVGTVLVAPPTPLHR